MEKYCGQISLIALNGDPSRILKKDLPRNRAALAAARDKVSRVSNHWSSLESHGFPFRKWEQRALKEKVWCANSGLILCNGDILSRIVLAHEDVATSFMMKQPVWSSAG